MALTRERRSNAGNKMAKLLNEEEDDDFYKTTYGGFEEVEQDHDYMEEDEGEDEVDSDFSIDENDEPVSDPEQEGPRKKRRLVTKAYKEPKVTSTPQLTPKVKKKRPPKSTRPILDKSERKSIRRSTAAKSAATQRRLKERNEDQKKKVKLVRHDVWKPTQQELLEEALLTEELNLKSLEKYQKLENEKKNTRLIRKIQTGPMIRYQSLAMPVMVLTDTLLEKEDEKINVEADDEKMMTGNPDTDPSELTLLQEHNTSKETLTPDAEARSKEEKRANPATISTSHKETDVQCVETGLFYERTFVTFENEQLFLEAFKKTAQLRPPLKALCSITRLPARYLDPMTQQPYRNIQTFRLLREAYYQQLEARSDPNDTSLNPDLLRWLEWRQKSQSNGIAQRSTIRLEPASIPTIS
ncbi:vacuolar protein sorting-associated protein 72 homolog [Orussus abietinus]|uniref:vacuolar protein sorting-associated protein 72 homolog n=1 Tax=Orussus abietinus TaxID=222816 RepID=UPI000625F186|nr:vacuolar protein sorting-associated protein 72 homolog [Orussus abietinus]